MAVMIRTVVFTSLVVFLMIMMVEATVYQQKLFKTISNPNLDSEFIDSSDVEITGCKDQNKCSLLCVKDEKCEAAVYDSSTQKCSLLYKDVSVTIACQPNDLVYLQNVGSDWATVGTKCSLIYKDVSATTSSQPNDLVYLENVSSDWTTVGTDRPSSSPPKVIKVYKDCQEAFEYGERSSGVYGLIIQGYDSFNVWCNFDDDHGWTVIQRRQDGSVDFYLNWADYKKGFGDIDGEYWLGNDNIYELTKTNQKLHFYLESTDGDYRHANYSQFYINDESDFYKMTLSTVDYSGDAEERVSKNNQMKFSTKDSDRDTAGLQHCAEKYKGGWWYPACGRVNVNGVYYSNAVYYGWYGYVPLLKVTMELSRD